MIMCESCSEVEWDFKIECGYDLPPTIKYLCEVCYGKARSKRGSKNHILKLYINWTKRKRLKCLSSSKNQL